MKTLCGTAVASGIVRGTVCLYSGGGEETVPHYGIEPASIPGEIDRLRGAFAKARADMEQVIQVVRARHDQQAADIFNTHLMILSDDRLLDKISRLIESRAINAEHAVSDVFAEYLKRYESQTGHFRELTHDFIDTRDRLLAMFSRSGGGGFKCDAGIASPVIVAAKRLTPSMVLNIPRENVLAFVTEEGGITSHATILARSYNVPIVFGISVEQELDCGMQVIVDGSLGKAIVDPDAVTGEYYAKKLRAIERKRLVCAVNKDLEPRTRGGYRVGLKLNISTAEDFTLARGLPHDGVGLLRTEFLFAQRNEQPSEDELVALYRELLGEEAGKPVTVRLLDISADKLPPFLSLPRDINTDMELRGAMAVETFPGLYLRQARALLRANAAGNLRLLFPMVSDVNDFRTFAAVVARARAELKKEGIALSDGKIPQGVMVETPAAVMLIDELLGEADFINIGSNDLLQYTLAAARGNPLAEERYHILHPALVKMLAIAARAGKKARKEVCLCGEIASFEEYFPLLLAAGLESFSVAPAKFLDIKCALLHLPRAGRARVLAEYYRTRSKKEADRFLNRFV